MSGVFFVVTAYVYIYIHTHLCSIVFPKLVERVQYASRVKPKEQTLLVQKATLSWLERSRREEEREREES